MEPAPSAGTILMNIEVNILKSNRMHFLVVLMFMLTACRQAPAPTSFTVTEAAVSAETPTPEKGATQAALKTTMGDFQIVAAKFVDEANGVKPGPGEKILLLILSRPRQERLEPGTFPLEDFDKMIHDTSKGEIYILGNDGSKTISTMGGWVNEEFAMGFRLPAGAGSLKLFWPGNDPIDIVPEDLKS
jgi:hypothetical protein